MNRTFSIVYSCPASTWENECVVDAMLEDLLYGQTFRVLPDRQEVVHLLRKPLRRFVCKTGEYSGRVRFTVQVPAAQFVCGSANSVLVQLWGNVLDYPRIRLEQIDPDLIVSMRPRHQPQRAIWQAMRRPLLATVLKPSWSLTLRERVNICRQFIQAGGDFVKEDETYTPESARLLDEAKAIQSAMDATRGTKRGLGIYVPNLTGVATDHKSLRLLRQAGVRAGMVAFLAAGLDTTSRIASTVGKDWFLWGHRVGYDSMRSTLSGRALAQLAFAVGLDAVHVGTPILRHANSLRSTRSVIQTIDELRRLGQTRMAAVFSKTTRDILPAIIATTHGQCILIACGEFRNEGSIDGLRIHAWIEAAHQACPKMIGMD